MLLINYKLSYNKQGDWGIVHSKIYQNLLSTETASVTISAIATEESLKVKKFLKEYYKKDCSLKYVAKMEINNYKVSFNYFYFLPEIDEDLAKLNIEIYDLEKMPIIE